MKRILQSKILTFTFTAVTLLITSMSSALAQAESAAESSGDSTGLFLVGTIATVLAVFLFIMFIMSDKIIKMATQAANPNSNAFEEGSGFSLFPSKKELVQVEAKSENLDSRYVKLKKGVNIDLAGEADLAFDSQTIIVSDTHAIKPTDFHGMSSIPKVAVEIGTEVKAGETIMFDKKRPDVLYSTPVSGEVVEIRRGEKRAINEVVILADKEVKYKNFETAGFADFDRDKMVKLLLTSGCWPFLVQRPYGIVADPSDTPKAIFISTFSSAPLAPNYNYTLKGEDRNFQAGLDALNKLTKGKVHIGLDSTAENDNTFTDAKGVQINYFKGKHPVGNVGVQIHHIDPINKGETVWTVNPEDVATIGRLMLEGVYKPIRNIALTGSVVNNPRYFKTLLGANLKNILDGNCESEEDLRYISGNALMGTQIKADGYLGYYDNQITVMNEGNKHELLGWILPSYPRPSTSPTFLTHLVPALHGKIEANANTHGEKRALVVTGQFEEVLPMDIYPNHLIKAIITNDFDNMEGLGIYEVIEEDLAVCEFVDTSKNDITSILRTGLDAIREQG